MTPEQARDLLDNFDRLLPFESELAMEGAAKDMAAMIAGMHAEYRAEYQSSFGRWYPAPHCCANGSGWGTKQQAERAADYWKADGFATRIVPRYVTEPEEA